MEYRRFQNTIIARMDKGEEILEKLKEISSRENVKLATVQALGAVKEFTVGVFFTKEKQYCSNEFCGDFEIVSLAGTVNTMNGEFYCHLHMSAGKENGEVFGGHLSQATVSATCEMIIHQIDGAVERRYEEKTGLNILRF